MDNMDDYAGLFVDEHAGEHDPEGEPTAASSMTGAATVERETDTRALALVALLLALLALASRGA